MSEKLNQYPTVKERLNNLVKNVIAFNSAPTPESVSRQLLSGVFTFFVVGNLISNYGVQTNNQLLCNIGEYVKILGCFQASNAIIRPIVLIPKAVCDYIESNKK